MSQQIINISTPDDGLGDALRNGFDKTNQNFSELYNSKVDKITGKGLSENDFTNSDKSKLNGIEAGAQVNVQADAAETDPLSPSYIQNLPPSLYSAVGHFHYSDLATQTAPLAVVANVAKKLTNDTLGVNTELDFAPYAVPTVWDNVQNSFVFSNLDLGDSASLRLDLSISTTAANQTIELYLKFGVGTASEYVLFIDSWNEKSTVTFKHFLKTIDFSIDNQDWQNAPAELFILSDANASVKVNGFYVPIIRKSVNIIDFNTDPLKLDKVSTAGVERAYIINTDGSQGTKATSDFKDVIEGYFNGTNFYTDALFTNLITTESGKIYINLAVTPATQYRWSGSAYVQIGGGGDLKVLHKNHISGISVVNNPNFTAKYAYGVLIPAGTIQVGDFIDIEVSFVKVSGGNAELYGGININTIDSLAGATVLGSTYVTSTTSVYSKIQRSLVVKNSALTEILHQGTFSFTSWSFANTGGNKNIDWSTDKYIVISIVNNGATDATWRMSSIIITKK